MLPKILAFGAFALLVLYLNGDLHADAIDVRFAGRDLTIPRAYFPIWAVPDLRDEPRTLILDAYLPSFTSYPTQKPSDGGHAESVQISLERGSASLNTSYALAAPNRIFEEPVQDVYGLRMFRTAFVGGDPGGRIHEVYFSAENDVVTTFIECQPLQPSPPCHQTLSVDGMIFEITYHRQYLSSWKNIEERTIGLMRGFVRATQ